MPTDTPMTLQRQALPGRSRIFTSFSSQQANAPRTRTARPGDADAATRKLAGDARKTFMSSCLKAS